MSNHAHLALLLIVNKLLKVICVYILFRVILKKNFIHHNWPEALYKKEKSTDNTMFIHNL